jgi:hypothetical protein
MAAFKPSPLPAISVYRLIFKEQSRIYYTRSITKITLHLRYHKCLIQFDRLDFLRRHPDRHPRESGDPFPENLLIGKHAGYWQWIPAFAGMTEWESSESLRDAKFCRRNYYYC